MNFYFVFKFHMKEEKILLFIPFFIGDFFSRLNRLYLADDAVFCFLFFVSVSGFFFFFYVSDSVSILVLVLVLVLVFVMVFFVCLFILLFFIGFRFWFVLVFVNATLHLNYCSYGVIFLYCNALLL
jgi:hypothetical protein